ncbi:MULTISPECIES: serine hydrolase domain-containing protein [unclassified Bradyrhizobium]|uniref:serine hydrolase domain-containing protein n=1 Tax=unclassified Bradyrhizobium TaxID=2631580 RepID=UPI0028EE7D89|nr:MULTISPECIES: serine hydrolase domain-containing protein [unclassified Bradyrhizobium]
MSRRVDEAIERALAQKRIVGAVVIVAKDGHIVYRRAAGYLNREAGTPIPMDALFRLASLSKPIVTAAALALVEKGALGLDDPVMRWLPSFQPKLADGSSPTITVRELLTHTAGLSYGFLEPADGPYHRAGVSDGMDQSGLPMDDELRRIDTAGLRYSPGEDWGYSVATDVLGALISKAAGQQLSQVVRRLVTEPLVMAGTDLAAADLRRLAIPYVDGKSKPIRMADPDIVPFAGLAGISMSPGRALVPESFASGGSGMIGTADDYIRLLEAFRQGGGVPILKPSTVNAMMTNQIGRLRVKNRQGWGFGFGAAVILDPKTAGSPQSPGTWTWSGVYGHSFFVDPQRNLSVVALTNTAIEGMNGALTIDIRDAVYDVSSR